MSQKINISIIIPVKNGIATIRQCLDAIFSQTLIKQAEVIVIDSGSTDGTLEVLQQYPVRLYQIPPEEFNHGATRNYGVLLAKGEFVVMTVQDAVAVNPEWLNIMLNHFSDPNLAGVCGRQMIPEEIDKNPGAWTQTFSKPVFKKTSFSQGELKHMKPSQKKENCGWDNVTAAYRKSVLIDNPFPTTNYSEDIHWAWHMFNKGFCLGYEPKASVWHYHHETFHYRYKRHLIEITNHFLLYNLKTWPKVQKSDLIPFYQLFKNQSTKKVEWCIYNFKLLAANRLAETFFFMNLILGGNDRVSKTYFYITKEIPIGKANEKN